LADREAILEGAQAAHRLHAELGTRALVEREGLSCIDVFAVAMRLGAMLLFRRLEGLLGAYVPNPAAPGIIISTQRSLHVQRFTAAHEIGHLFLRHELSLDEEVGLWRGASRNPREAAADSFASEFMLPKWLYIYHAGRQLWERAALQDPKVVYQLSLRLGASYDATCYGLEGHRILTHSIVAKLRAEEPKRLKLAALAGRAELTNSWADVWTITQADDGLTFQGGPEDIVIFRIPERVSAGYLWDESRLRADGLELLADEREEATEGDCGTAVTRVLVTRVAESREYRVSFAERRPWRPDDAAASLTVSFDMHGKEEGLPRLARKAIAAA
jgi:Zn-dependent peptidase ImmA (M78 family)